MYMYMCESCVFNPILTVSCNIQLAANKKLSYMYMYIVHAHAYAYLTLSLSTVSRKIKLRADSAVRMQKFVRMFLAMRKHRPR